MALHLDPKDHRWVISNRHLRCIDNAANLGTTLTKRAGPAIGLFTIIVVGGACFYTFVQVSPRGVSSTMEKPIRLIDVIAAYKPRDRAMAAKMITTFTRELEAVLIKTAVQQDCGTMYAIMLNDSISLVVPPRRQTSLEASPMLPMKLAHFSFEDARSYDEEDLCLEVSSRAAMACSNMRRLLTGESGIEQICFTDQSTSGAFADTADGGAHLPGIVAPTTQVTGRVIDNMIINFGGQGTPKSSNSNNGQDLSTE